MSLDVARSHVLEAQLELSSAAQHLADALVALEETVTPPPIGTPALLEAAIAASVPGAVLTLATSLVYPGPLTVRTPITLKSETYDVRQGLRMERDEPAPRFLNGLTLAGDDVQGLGLDVRHTDPLRTIVTVSGARCLLDRVRVLGDPLKGGKRGIDFRGSTQAQLRHFLIDDIFAATIDTQAIYSGTMGPGGGLIVDDGYASAAGQGCMFGGEDPASADHIPSHIAITRSRFTKNPLWMLPRGGAGVLTAGQHAQQVKCAIEFKNAIDVVVDDCDLEGAGTSDGMQGFLIIATPRNQGNTARFSTVQDLTIKNCRGRLAAGIANLLGSDNLHPSGPLAGFTLQEFTASDIDPTGITGGRGWLFQLDRAPQRVTLDGVTVTGGHLQALGMFLGAAPIGFVARRLQLPPSKYGWKINAGKSGHAALQAYMPDAQLDDSVI